MSKVVKFTFSSDDVVILRWRTVSLEDSDRIYALFYVPRTGHEMHNALKVTRMKKGIAFNGTEKNIAWVKKALRHLGFKCVRRDI